VTEVTTYIVIDWNYSDTSARVVVVPGEDVQRAEAIFEACGVDCEVLAVFDGPPVRVSARGTYDEPGKPRAYATVNDVAMDYALNEPAVLRAIGRDAALVMYAATDGWPYRRQMFAKAFEKAFGEPVPEVQGCEVH
jgi:hypothetical protein